MTTDTLSKEQMKIINDCRSNTESNIDDNNPSSSVSSTITIQLHDKHSSIQNHYEIDASDPLSTILKQYANFNGYSLDTDVKFTYNGQVLTNDGDDTPISLGMIGGDKSGDDVIIEVSLIGDKLIEYTLIDAIINNLSTSEVIAILEQNKELCTKPLKWTDSDGQELCTPVIFIVIDYGRNELLQQMLSSSLYTTDTINTISSDTNGQGYTPLQWASWTGCHPIVTTLIEIGKATVDEESVSLSREYDHHELSSYLSQHVDIYANIDENDIDAIMDKACREGDINKVRQILDDTNNIYDLNQWKDTDGKFMALSPMYMAVKFGHYDIMQLFMDRGGGEILDDVESALAAPAVAE
jgi:ankyrin repeat protein